MGLGEKIVARVILTLGAVGCYYLWHGVFKVPTAPSVVGSLVLWMPVASWLDD